jgi:hypothetical protein
MHWHSHRIAEYSDPNYPGIGGIGNLRGLGETTQGIAATVASGIGVTTSLLVAFSVIGGPVGAAVGAIVAAGQALVSIFKGCGNTCVEATAIVNQVEPVLQQNLEAYLSSPTRTQSMQAAALNNFATAWNAVVTNCSNASLGTAGQNCISQRQQGACAYKTSPGGWQQSGGTWQYVNPGANGSGDACWNWFIGYHDPIANDPAVVPDTAVATSSASASTDTAGDGATASTGSAVSDFLDFSTWTPETWVLVGVVAFALLGGLD